MKLPRFPAASVLGCFLLAAAKTRAQEARPPASTPPPAAPTSAPVRTPAHDADALLTKEEVAVVQGCAIKDASGHLISGEPLRVTQCFYTAAEANKSVVVVMMQTNPADPKKRSIREFWEGIFSKFDKPEDEEEEARERDEKKAPETAGKPAAPAKVEEENEEEEKRKHPPRRIKELGEEAFWTRSHVNGTLFVLKGEAMLRVSVGGSEDDDKQIGKCRALAEKALARL